MPDPAEELFAAFLEQVEQGADIDFDALCGQHPEHAAALCRMHRHWLAIDPDLLISSTGAGGLAFWDLDSGECCLQLLKDVAPIGQLQLSSDGHTLSCLTQQGPLLLDLEYRERHVAGNLADWLARLRAEGPIDEARAAALTSWAARVLARPWPRWR